LNPRTASVTGRKREKPTDTIKFNEITNNSRSCPCGFILWTALQKQVSCCQVCPHSTDLDTTLPKKIAEVWRHFGINS
jgi:hypothetical protein